MCLKAPLCNRRAHTAPMVRGRCFPLCWRCTSIIAAIILLDRLAPELPGDNPWLVGAGLAMLALGIFDGWRSHFSARGTSNGNRILFGLSAGAGLFLVVAAS